MKQLLRCLLLGLCIAICNHTWAQAPKVMARATLQNTEAVVAGQQVRLTIDALTTTWFVAAPIYPDLNIANAIVTPTDERSQNFNETIGQETWFGISRSYAITPTGEGDITIPPLTLTLSPGQGDGPLTATTETITIKVEKMARPAGTENLLVSTDVQIKQTLDRKLNDVKVGDAITRTIEIQAVGVQGMFITPTSFPAINGLALYPKTGSIDNHIKDKKDVSGSTRIDAATYVIQSAGKYVLPEIKLEWWNPVSRKTQVTSAPALEFQAVANPDYNTEFSLPQDATNNTNHFLNWHLIGLLASAALVVSIIVYLLWQYLPRVITYLCDLRRARQERYAASEPAAYQRLKSAIASNDAAQTYSALLSWVEHPARPQNQRSLDALSINNPALTTHINTLRTALFDTSTPPPSTPSQWQGSALLQAIAPLRQQQPNQASGTHLQPLNPH